MLPSRLFVALSLSASTLLAACDDGAADGDDAPLIDAGPASDDSGAGACSWSHRFGGASADRALGVVALPDGGLVVVGYTRSYDGDLVGMNPSAADLAVVIRYDAGGAIVWTKILPAGTRAEDVRLGLDGDLVVVGQANEATGCANYHGAEDAWLARLAVASGDVLAMTCIGGDDDDDATAVREVLHDGVRVIEMLGRSDSDGDGNVGEKHGGGGVDSPDLLYGTWHDDAGAPPTNPYGHLFGSGGPESGVAFLADRVLAGNTFGDDGGDLAGTTMHGFSDVWFAMLPVASADCGPEACPVTVVRTGGDSNDTIRAGTPDGIVVGGTRSRTGELACPRPEDDLDQAWIGRFSRAEGFEQLACLGGSAGDEALDVIGTDDALYVTGTTGSDDGDFAGAERLGDDVGYDSGFIARYDLGATQPSWTATRAHVGSAVSFDAVTVTTAGCVVAVGHDGLDFFVQAHPR